MTKMRSWSILAVVAIAAVLAAGWFLALSPQKSKVAKLHSQAAGEVQQNTTLTGQIALLKKQQAQIPAEQARIAEIKDRLPSTPALTAYVRTLVSLAAANHLELVSIAPTGPTVVQATSSTSAPTAQASGASAPAAAAAAPVPASSLSTISVAIDVVGDYYNIQQFLAKIEDTKRVTIVSSVAMQPGSVLQPVQQTGGVTSAGGNAAGTSWRTIDAQITASIFMVGAPDATAGNGSAQTPAQGAKAGATAAASPSATPTASNN